LLNFNHIVLVGFGPTGQAVAKRLCQTRKDANNALLVILTRTATADAVRLANKLNAVILYGDPSSQVLLKRAINRGTPFVYVAMDDDLATLDAIEAVQGSLRDLENKRNTTQTPKARDGGSPGVKTKVRAFFSDMDVVHNLADADASGFWLQEKPVVFRSNGKRRNC
jgi:Kef-type K+ transport systems, predicted NAD-binding component